MEENWKFLDDPLVVEGSLTRFECWLLELAMRQFSYSKGFACVMHL